MQHRQSFLFVIRFWISSKQTREGLGVESGSLPAGQFSIPDLRCNSENRPQQAKGSKVQYLAGINKAAGGSHFWKRLSYPHNQFLRTPKRHRWVLTFFWVLPTEPRNPTGASDASSCSSQRSWGSGEAGLFASLKKKMMRGVSAQKLSK